MSAAVIAPGDRVQDIRDRSRVGTVEAGPKLRAGRQIFTIRWQDTQLTNTPSDFLIPFEETTDLRGLLRSHAFGGYEDFVRNFTHRKLLKPVDDTLYSLHASRTRLMPHQFKPLLRFLDSIHRRYLIADEVGLGKTIEAGIILSELRARGVLGGVLVVCPNNLRDKWRTEMRHRFDEHFAIVASRREWLRLVASGAEPGSARGMRIIVGRETLASAAVLDRLKEEAPSFDLLVVDEAHHFRNASRISHQVLRILADAAEQLLLLTATPLQTGSENLLSLLRLLDEQAFPSHEMLRWRLEVNARLVRAERALRMAPPRSVEGQRAALDTARVELASLPAVLFDAFGTDHRTGFEAIVSRVDELRVAPAFTAIAELAADVREHNLLSPYLTRTRKVEVQDTCRRNVESVRPDWTPEEQRFYEETVRWIRRAIERDHGSRSVLFLSRNIERRLASCLRAFARSILLHARHTDSPLFRDPPAEVIHAAQALGDTDSKLESLDRLLSDLRATRPGSKVIVFASYKATLRHLSQALRDRGIDHVVIHGEVHSAPEDQDKDERGRRVRRFLTDDHCTVLLSSNLGGEGLDLQRASVVINYDLPWNPAVIEQRIGRIDRFGQTERIVQVQNLLLPGTVEDHIFTRLFHRLALFETALGDFGEVLGEVVNEMSMDFLRSELTEVERERRLDEIQWRIQNEQRHLQDVLDHEQDLVAFDQDFAEQLRRMDSSGQTIRPRDLVEVVGRLLKRHFPGAILQPLRPADSEASGRSEGVYALYIDMTLEAELRALSRASDREAFRRLLYAVAGDRTVRICFDGEVAEAEPDTILLTSRHPFVRWLVAFRTSEADFHPVSALALSGTAVQEMDLTDGLLCLCDGTVQFGSHERRYLLPVWVTDCRAWPVAESRRVLGMLLSHSSSSPGTGAPAGEALCEMVRLAEEVAQASLDEIADRIVTKQQNLVRPRVAEARERFARRIAAAEERVRQLEWGVSFTEETNQREVQKKLSRARASVRRLERDRDARIAELSRIDIPELMTKTVGAAWVEVTP